VSRLLGILGGTFDPVHLGHVALGRELCERGMVDRLHYVVNAAPPHRRMPGANTADRLAMLRIALAGEAHLVADAREVRRGGTSYTIDSLKEIRAECGAHQPLVLVVGADAFAGLSGWRAWQALPGMVHLMVMARPRMTEIPGFRHPGLVEVEDVRALRDAAFGLLWIWRTCASPLSSSEARARLAAGLETDDLLSASVREYIERHRLYTRREESIGRWEQCRFGRDH